MNKRRRVRDALGRFVHRDNDDQVEHAYAPQLEEEKPFADAAQDIPTTSSSSKEPLGFHIFEETQDLDPFAEIVANLHLGQPQQPPNH